MNKPQTFTDIYNKYAQASQTLLITPVVNNVEKQVDSSTWTKNIFQKHSNSKKSICSTPRESKNKNELSCRDRRIEKLRVQY